jgi:uncharacterized protein (DUF1501 family)
VKSGFAGASLFFVPMTLSAATSPRGRKLVIVQLTGGNDTLNTFIPYADSRYRAARPDLGIPDQTILHVDTRIGFHPEMKALFDLYQRRKFTFVTNVGFPSLDRSHFNCEAIWHTADENPAETRGWVGRWADLYAAAPYSPAVNVGIAWTHTPQGLVADRVPATCFSTLDSFVVEGDADPNDAQRFARTLRRLYARRSDNALLRTISEQGANAFEAIDFFRQMPPPSVVAGYPDTPVASALRTAAQVVDASNDNGVIWVALDGFDTHSEQIGGSGSLSGTHATLLRQVSEGLGAFQRDVEHRGVSDRVVVLGWSEFGRRVQENASHGTDHGKGGTVFLLGDAIKGGEWYGDAYDLADLDEGDLKPRIDFRSIYATLIQHWLGGDPELVLGRKYEQLGFITTSVPRRRIIRR